MSFYIQELKAEDERRAAEAQAKSEAASLVAEKTARDAMRPLDARLSDLLASIPAELRREGLSLLAIQARLRGRQGGVAQAGELGLALRRLGWTRKRGWRGGPDGGFRATWHEPRA